MSGKPASRTFKSGKVTNVVGKPLAQNPSAANAPKLAGAKRQRETSEQEPQTSQIVKEGAEAVGPVLKRFGSAVRVLATDNAASKPSAVAPPGPVPNVPLVAPLPRSTNILDELQNDDEEMSTADSSVPAPVAATAPPAPVPATKVAVNTAKPKAPAVVAPVAKKAVDKERRLSTSSTTSRSSSSFRLSSSVSTGAAASTTGAGAGGAGLTRTSSKGSMVPSRPAVTTSSSASASSSAPAPSSGLVALTHRGKAAGMAGMVASLGKVITAVDTAKAIEVARKAEGAMKSALASTLPNIQTCKSYAMTMAKKNAMLQAVIEHHLAVIESPEKVASLVSALYLDPALLTKLKVGGGGGELSKSNAQEQQAKAAQNAAQLAQSIAEVARLQSEVTKARKAVGEMEADKAARVASLEASLDKATAAAKGASQEAMDMRNQLQAVQDELSKKSGELDIALQETQVLLSKQKGQHASVVQELRAKYEATMADFSKAKAAAEATIQDKVRELSSVYEALEAARKQAADGVRAEEAKAIHAVRAKEAQLEDKEEEIARLKGEAQRMREELEATVAQLQEEVAAVTEELHITAADLEAVTVTHEATEVRLQGMMVDYEATREQLSAEVAARSSAEERIAELEARLAQAQAQYQGALTAHSTQLATLQGKADFFQQRFEAVDAKRAALVEQVLSLKGAIRVMARVRPALPMELAGGTAGASAATGGAGRLSKGKAEEPLFYFPDGSEDACSLELHERPGAGVGGYGTASEGKQSAFSFNRVFPPTAGNEDVFSEVEGLVESALNGSKVCIFAYGQTGSGKTYTMQGGAEDPGLIPRSLHYLFGRVEVMEGRGWAVTMQASMLEIYNESVRDLLVGGAGKGAGSAPELALVQSKDGSGFEAKGLSAHSVTGPQDVEDLLAKAAAARAVGSTAMNAQSSRSHALFTLSIRAVHSDVGGSVVKAGQLHLVDLAGSERLDKSGSEGQAKTEAAAINTSLTHLAGVIRALQTGEKHVPYRNSALTKVLQSSLGGGACKTLLLATLNPLHANVQESMSTLRFASGVAKVETK